MCPYTTMIDVLIKREIGTQTYSQERAQCGDEGRDEALLPHVKHTRDHQQTARSQGTGREQTGSQSPQAAPLLTPWPQSSSL